MKKAELGQEKYTAIDDWERYWLNREVKPVTKIYFDNVFPRADVGRLTAMEIGGYPGIMAGYLTKKYGYKCTIIDYVGSQGTIRKVEQMYGLESNSIDFVVEDIFSVQRAEKFDLVTSYGFIEHFEDIKNILLMHKKFMKDGAHLFCTIPNFKGINGLVQFLFDRENLSKHNLKSMNIRLLKKVMAELSFQNIKVYYYGRPTVWLENKSTMDIKYLKKIIKIVNIILKRIPVNCKILSPHIILEGKILSSI